MKVSIPSDDDLCRMVAKVIMKVYGFDAEHALECARRNFRDRRRRKQDAQEQKDRAARRLWARMATDTL